MKKQIILVAAHQLIAATIGKDDKREPLVVEPGEELTPAKLKALGLSEKDLPRLKEVGAVEEVSARASEVAGSGITLAQLNAVEKRASDAETALGAAKDEVTTLTTRATEAEAALKAANEEIAALKAANEEIAALKAAAKPAQGGGN